MDIATAKEEVYLAWSNVQLGNIPDNWDIDQKAYALREELQKSDSSAKAVVDGSVIKVTYKGCEVPIYIMTTSSAVYSYKGEYNFNGSDYLNTDVCLYSKENINKNFLISFNIVSVARDNVDHNTILSSMDESGTPWPGHNVKIYIKNSAPQITLESNSNISSTGDAIIPSRVTNVRIIRINHKLYYSFDNQQCIQINDYTGFTNTFNTPVTFGAGLDENNSPFRFFKGTLSDITIKFISDEASIEYYNPSAKRMKIVYEHPDLYGFNGETDYIDTGLSMFTRETISKDFEISFKIEYIESGYENQAALVNGKYENQSVNYPGFVYRLYSANSAIKLEAKGGTGSSVSNSQSSVKEVKISRINQKLYLSINEGVAREIYDFTAFSNYFDVPITIGCSLNNGTTPFRFFKGALSDIIVKVEE